MLFVPLVGAVILYPLVLQRFYKLGWNTVLKLC